jgi:hypothetical protein
VGDFVKIHNHLNITSKCDFSAHRFDKPHFHTMRHGMPSTILVQNGRADFSAFAMRAKAPF